MSRNFTPDTTLIDNLLADDTSAFEEIHRRYCYSLYAYCFGKLNSPDDARRIVRNLFIWLWENRHTLPVSFSISAHFYTEVRKAVVQCLNDRLTGKAQPECEDNQFFPGFSIHELQQARQPIIGSDTSAYTFATRKKSLDAGWNRYPDAINPDKLKKVLRDFLNSW
jgi:hypothetical protein